MTPSPSPVAAVLAELEGLLANAVSATPWWQDSEWVVSVHGGTVTHVNRGEPDAALIVAAVNALPRLLAAVRAVDELHTPRTCSCGGRRWTKDENWSPRDYERGREREEGAGLVPCGFCNHGGWNTEQWDVDGAVSCEQCDFIWPCDTAIALRSAFAAVDVTEATE